MFRSARFQVTRVLGVGPSADPSALVKVLPRQVVLASLRDFVQVCQRRARAQS
jgi:hypothetical protein